MTSPAHPSRGDDDGLPDFRARRTGRVEVTRATAQLSPGERYEVEIKVRNLSTAGFMAECAEPLRIGSFVALEIAGIGTVEAQIRWQIGSRMGGMFLDPISLDRCEWTAERTDNGHQAIV